MTIWELFYLLGGLSADAILGFLGRVDRDHNSLH